MLTQMILIPSYQQHKLLDAFSYREVGLKYLREMEEHGFVTNEELANYHGISHVSVSKRVQAAKINSTLIALFPDYEAIPNSYYNRLFRLQKNIEKNLFSLEEVVENTREEIRDLDISDIAEAQKNRNGEDYNGS
nr:hypothetical protein [Escherichia coli]